MDNKTHVLLASKLLEVCGCDKSSAIFAAIPSIDKEPLHLKNLYGHMLKNKPLLLDSAIEIFTNKKMGVAKKSHAYQRIKEEKENFISLLQKLNQKKLNDDKIAAALALISHVYFDTFTIPVQFFIPHSSACLGQWDLWEKIDYLALKEKFHEKEFTFDFREKIEKSEVWVDLKYDIKIFPLIIQRRLQKERSLGKKLNPKAMIKAMIIRLGEMAKPNINYETIDYSIRFYLRYLNVNEYLRIDREMEFLKRLESEITKLIETSLENS